MKAAEDTWMPGSPGASCSKRGGSRRSWRQSTAPGRPQPPGTGAGRWVRPPPTSVPPFLYPPGIRARGSGLTAKGLVPAGPALSGSGSEEEEEEEEDEEWPSLQQAAARGGEVVVDPEDEKAIEMFMNKNPPLR